jgi:hypothetical protein
MPRPFRSPPCRIQTSTNWNAFWRVMRSGRTEVGRSWATRWDGERPGFCSVWQGCRVCGWKRGAIDLWFADSELTEAIGLYGAAQSPQCLVAVEQLDILGLSSGEAANGPGQMNEMRLVRSDQGMHAAFLRK